jgi:transposase
MGCLAARAARSGEFRYDRGHGVVCRACGEHRRGPLRPRLTASNQVSAPMPGTVRKIIDRIKEQRSSGNSVVALTVETRLVLQGFDPQRFEYQTADEPGRLARVQEVAEEMQVYIDDLLASADVAPDPDAAPEPPPDAGQQARTEGLAESAQAVSAAAGIGRAPAGPARAQRPDVPDDHPLQAFKRIADAALAAGRTAQDGAQTGASFAVLVKSSLLMALYSIGKDSVYCDQLPYHALFQWFLGLDANQARFDAQGFAADREQALASAAGRRFFDRVVPEASREKLFSSDRLQVNSRQVKSWMSQHTNA